MPHDAMTLGTARSTDLAAIRAERRRIVVDGIDLRDWRFAPVAAGSADGAGLPGAAGPQGAVGLLGEGGPEVLRLVAVTSGTLRYWTRDQAFEGRAGSLHLLPAERDTRYAVPEPTRLLRIGLPRSVVAPSTLRAMPAAGPLRPTRLANGFVALVEQVLGRIGDRTDNPAAHAIRSLASAVLEESVPEGEEVDLRRRLLDHIEQHLGEQDLGPRSIADAFGISLRWVHRVFDVDGASVARHIRERRTDAVAAHLRSNHRWIRVGALAARYGFAGRDQLTRAFKARYGLTVAAYADAIAEGRPLPAPRSLLPSAEDG